MEKINFSDLNLSKGLLKSLEQMGFDAPTPVQAQAITPMIEKKDILVQAPTGTGKTGAFGIPVIEGVDTKSRDIQSVILCPTRELAIQTTEVLQKLSTNKPGVRIAALYGGQQIGRQINLLKKRPQIIVATPGRMMDHIRRRTTKLNNVSLVVLDEADRMLDMGFREDMDVILESVPEERQTVLFSATLSSEIKKIAELYQSDAEKITVRNQTLTVDSVKQFYSEIRHSSKGPALVNLLEEKKFPLSLVFVATKSMADLLSRNLNDVGIRAEALHGDLQQRQRDRVMDKYRKGYVNVLVATDIAARGIDVNNIDAVINYDIPQDCDSYVHRIGRTGRADKTGVAYTFISPKEQSKLRTIMRVTKAKIAPIKLSTAISESFKTIQAAPRSKPATNKDYSDKKSGYRKNQKPTSKQQPAAAMQDGAFDAGFETEIPGSRRFDRRNGRPSGSGQNRNNSRNQNGKRGNYGQGRQQKPARHDNTAAAAVGAAL